MKKNDFIKLIDGDLSYLDECLESIKNVANLPNMEIELSDDILSDINGSLIEHMVTFRDIWCDDEKNYSIRFKWNVISWLYKYSKKNETKRCVR